jgi:DNA replication ATP-dependent helicase Dna2
VITPYRQQIKILSAMLQDMKAIEVLTADKSQGRDKDCIIISMVRSNDLGSVSPPQDATGVTDSPKIGELLRDWRRINVSFTRAKKKLIIIGSKSTLSADDRLLADFFSLIEEKQWILDLPRDAEKVHGGMPEKVEVKRERSVGRGKLSEALVESRPFIRDILNVSCYHATAVRR